MGIKMFFDDENLKNRNIFLQTFSKKIVIFLNVIILQEVIC